MSVSRHIGSTLATNVLNLLFSIANSVLLARILGVEGRGEYAFFITSVALVSLLLGIGSASGSIFFSAGKKQEPHTLLFIYMLQILGMMCLLAIPLFWVSLKGLHNLLLPATIQTEAVFGLLMLSVFLQLCGNVFSGILSGRLYIHALNVAKVLHIILLFVLLLYLFMQRTDSWNTYLVLKIYVYLQGLLLAMYMAVYIYRFGFPFGITMPDRQQVLSILAWGGITYFANIFQFLNYRLDFWFVEYYKQTEGLGIYALSTSLAQLLWIVPTAVSAVLFPYVSQGSESYTAEKAARLSRIVAAICFVLALLAAIPASWLIPAFYGQDFSGATPVFYILLLGTMPFCITNVIAGFFTGRNMVRINLMASLLGLLLTILLDILLIPLWGLNGAALASVVSYLSTSAWVLYFFNKRFSISYTNMVFIKKSDIYEAIKGLRNE